MSQSRRRRAERRAAEAATAPVPQGKSPPGSRASIIIISTFIVFLLAVAGIYYYLSPDQRYMRITVVSVNDINIPMDYFLKKLRLSGADAINMLTQIANEQVIKLAAPQFGIEVSAEAIDQTLREMFRGASENISEAEFREWYRQRLNDSGLSDAEFREIVATGRRATLLQQYLAEVMPTVREQVHLYAIFLETSKQADKARARWEKGESFSDLARELSTDEQTGQKGGELGWFPRGGVLNSRLEFEAFELTAGNVSAPLPIFSEETLPEGGEAPAIVGYYLLLVTEKAVRELDENALQVLKGNVLDEWLKGERQNYKISYRGINNGFDSETYAWINYQLSKSKPKSEQE